MTASRVWKVLAKPACPTPHPLGSWPAQTITEMAPCQPLVTWKHEVSRTMAPPPGVPRSRSPQGLGLAASVEAGRAPVRAREGSQLRCPRGLPLGSWARLPLPCGAAARSRLSGERARLPTLRVYF